MKGKKFWTEGWGSFGVAIFVALTIRWALFEAYVIPSASMLPTLLIHDHIFINKLVYGLRVPFSEKWLVQFGKPERGDIIVFKFPLDKGTFFIKRVVGLPGDKITYDNHKLFINDKEVENFVATDSRAFDWLRDADFQEGGNKYDVKSNYSHLMEKLGTREHNILHFKDEGALGGAAFLSGGSWTVPPDHLFMMGDNRDNSNDSRRWGFVPMENILGKAMFVWLSCEETLGFVPICNPLDLRWGRFFHPVHP